MSALILERETAELMEAFGPYVKYGIDLFGESPLAPQDRNVNFYRKILSEYYSQGELVEG